MIFSRGFLEVLLWLQFAYSFWQFVREAKFFRLPYIFFYNILCNRTPYWGVPTQKRVFIFSIFPPEYLKGDPDFDLDESECGGCLDEDRESCLFSVDGTLGRVPSGFKGLVKTLLNESSILVDKDYDTLTPNCFIFRKSEKASIFKYVNEGYRCYSVERRCFIDSSSNSVLNKDFFRMLSILPLVLQAKGMEDFSAVLSIAIIIIDFFSVLANSVWMVLKFYLITLLKLAVSLLEEGKREFMFFFLSTVSKSFLICDDVAKKCYVQEMRNLCISGDNQFYSEKSSAIRFECEGPIPLYSNFKFFLNGREWSFKHCIIGSGVNPIWEMDDIEFYTGMVQVETDISKERRIIYQQEVFETLYRSVSLMDEAKGIYLISSMSRRSVHLFKFDEIIHRLTERNYLLTLAKPSRYVVSDFDLTGVSDFEMVENLKWDNRTNCLLVILAKNYFDANERSVFCKVLTSLISGSARNRPMGVGNSKWKRFVSDVNIILSSSKYPVLFYSNTQKPSRTLIKIKEGIESGEKIIVPSKKLLSSNKAVAHSSEHNLNKFRNGKGMSPEEMVRFIKKRNVKPTLEGATNARSQTGALESLGGDVHTLSNLSKGSSRNEIRIKKRIKAEVDIRPSVNSELIRLSMKEPMFNSALNNENAWVEKNPLIFCSYKSAALKGLLSEASRLSKEISSLNKSHGKKIEIVTVKEEVKVVKKCIKAPCNNRIKNSIKEVNKKGGLRNCSDKIKTKFENEIKSLGMGIEDLNYYEILSRWNDSTDKSKLVLREETEKIEIIETVVEKEVDDPDFQNNGSRSVLDIKNDLNKAIGKAESEGLRLDFNVKKEKKKKNKRSSKARKKGKKVRVVEEPVGADQKGEEERLLARFIAPSFLENHVNEKGETTIWSLKRISLEIINEFGKGLFGLVGNSSEEGISLVGVVMLMDRRLLKEDTDFFNNFLSESESRVSSKELAELTLEKLKKSNKMLYELIIESWRKNKDLRPYNLERLRTELYKLRMKSLNKGERNFSEKWGRGEIHFIANLLSLGGRSKLKRNLRMIDFDSHSEKGWRVKALSGCNCFHKLIMESLENDLGADVVSEMLKSLQGLIDLKEKLKSEPLQGFR